MIKAIYPGTFDPLTNGHLDIIVRASKLVDELIVLVADNQLKITKFTVAERVEMIKNVTKDIPNIKIDHTNGLVVEYAKKYDIKIMFRGLRNFQDYEYEYQLSKYNGHINPDIETVLLFPSLKTGFISSSGIKELVYYDVDISNYIPKENIDIVKNKLRKLI